MKIREDIEKTLAPEKTRIAFKDRRVHLAYSTRSERMISEYLDTYVRQHFASITGTEDLPYPEGAVCFDGICLTSTP